MAALSDYFRVTAERVNFDELRESALRNAYCSGSGIVYTYWDERIPTGSTPICPGGCRSGGTSPARCSISKMCISGIRISRSFRNSPIS